MKLVFSISFTLFACLAFRLGNPFHRSSLIVTFFDVGQGDSSFIQFPNGREWIVDSGGGFGDYDEGRRLVLELARAGVLSIEKAILSHPDEDHAMGFRSLFSSIHIKEFLYQKDVPSFSRPVFRELSVLGKYQKIPFQPISEKQVGMEGGVRWELTPLNGKDNKSNHAALVLQLTYGDCEVLFTGDIEKEAELKLIHDVGDSIEILKVAHHGSKTSSTKEFLGHTKPAYSVVSTGYRNRYRHPHPQVLHRLHNAGTRILRTDQNGFIRFLVDPKRGVDCETFEGSCGRVSCRSAD